MENQAKISNINKDILKDFSEEIFDKTNEKTRRFVMKSSKRIFGLIGLLFFSFSTSSELIAYTLDVSTGVSAYATLEAFTAISIKIRDRASDVLKSSFTWGAVTSGADYELADSYIEINSTSNYSDWGIDVYTQNYVYVSTDTAYNSQFGGLIEASGTTDFARVPLLFIISGSTLTDGEITIGVSSPTVQSTVYNSTGTTGSMSWSYIKDKGDNDWATAQNNGSTRCLYGAPGYQNLPIGMTTENPNYLYVEGAFGSGVGGEDYITEIKFDLFHQ